MAKRALVISGGGSKGAFAVGVIQQLLASWPGLSFDIFVGTSTGALIVPFVALNEMQLLQQLYTTTTTKQVVTKFNIGDRVNEHSLFDVNPLWKLITTYLDEKRCNKLLTSTKTLCITTTCLQTELSTVFVNGNNELKTKHYEQRKMLSALHLQKAILASTCQPVFMPPVKVNKSVNGAANAEHQYVDGGVRQYAGIEMAIDAGATEIFTILLSSNNEVENTQYESLFTILRRTINIFIDDVAKNDLIIPAQYNEALSYIDAVKTNMIRDGLSTDTIRKYFTIIGKENPFEDKLPLKLFLIRPDEPLGGGEGGLDFNPSELQGMLATGKKAAQNFIAGIDKTKISWA